jgi:hypothetical protein
MFFAKCNPEATQPSTITFITKTLPLALLRTSKTMHDEAFPYFARTMEQLRLEPQRMLVDAPSLLCLSSVLELTGAKFNVHATSSHRNIFSSANNHQKWWPIPFTSSTIIHKSLAHFCMNCAFYLLAKKVQKTVVVIRRHPARDEVSLTRAVRQFRDDIRFMSGSAFGSEKPLMLLLSDPELERKEDATKAVELQATFDSIGREPVWTAWDLRIGGGLVLGGEEWQEDWAEG